MPNSGRNGLLARTLDVPNPLLRLRIILNGPWPSPGDSPTATGIVQPAKKPNDPRRKAGGFTTPKSRLGDALGRRPTRPRRGRQAGVWSRPNSRVRRRGYPHPLPSEPYGRVSPHTARAFANASRETRLTQSTIPDCGPGDDNWRVTTSGCTAHRCPHTPAIPRGVCASLPPTSAPVRTLGIFLLVGPTSIAPLSDPRDRRPS